MANDVGTARSNYFAVKDRAAFDARMQELDVEVVEGDGELVCLLSQTESGGWPPFDVETDEEFDETDEEFDFTQVVASHLADGHVAVLIEVGAEKFRYLVGRAVAVNSSGETRTVSLDDIYDLATGLGEHVTPAEY